MPIQLRRTTMTSLFVGSLLLQFIGASVYFILFTDTGFVQAVYSMTKILMIAIPIVLISSGFTLPAFSLHKNVLRSLAYGVTSGLFMSGSILGVFFAFHGTFNSYSSQILAKVIDVGILPYYLLAAIGVSVLHSLFEEVFWRWYAERGLEHFVAPGRAMVIGAGLFALHHYVLLSQFVPWELTLLFGTLVGVGGLIWSWIYHRAGSLASVWVSHAIVDATLFYIGYLLIW